MKIKIGTRGSKLALWQANKVAEELALNGIESEIKIYKTTGDLNQVQALDKIGDKGLFTKALDDALINREIDLAVHSSKDVPTVFDEKLEFAATLSREDPRDVLLALSPEVDLDNFSRQLVIGTSSLRRQAFLKRYAPQCAIKLIRGNVDTRIEKMRRGEYDGIILAYAGVKRMGLTEHIVRKINATTFVPAVGQGAVAIMCNRDAEGVKAAIQPLNHVPTFQAVTAERAYLRKMEGGCHVPIFALATIIGENLSINGGVASLDGKEMVSAEMQGKAKDAEQVGLELAQQILNNGGGKLIHD